VSGAAYYICPRCGRPIDHLERKAVRRIGKDGKVHEQVYFYARHYARGPNGEVIRVNGQPKIEKKCYLGPETCPWSAVITTVVDWGKCLINLPNELSSSTNATLYSMEPGPYSC